MVVKVNNFGTSDVTIHRIRVNGETASTWSTGNSETVFAGSEETFTIAHEVTETKKMLNQFKGLNISLPTKIISYNYSTS